VLFHESHQPIHRIALNHVTAFVFGKGIGTAAEKRRSILLRQAEVLAKRSDKHSAISSIRSWGPSTIGAATYRGVSKRRAPSNHSVLNDTEVSVLSARSACLIPALTRTAVSLSGR